MWIEEGEKMKRKFDVYQDSIGRWFARRKVGKKYDYVGLGYGIKKETAYIKAIKKGLI
jgi:hypothetical protein